MTVISKAACVPAVMILSVLSYVLVLPDQPALVIASCVILGTVSLGIYPIMLELSVECTYPLDESVVTGLCYLSSAIQVGQLSIGVQK